MSLLLASKRVTGGFSCKWRATSPLGGLFNLSFQVFVPSVYRLHFWTVTKMCRHECVKLRILLFRSSEVKHIWPKFDFHHITMSEWKMRRGKTSSRGVQIQPSRVRIQPGFQSDQAESTIAEKSGSPGQPVSTRADRNPGGNGILGHWVWTPLSYRLSKVTASPLLAWPHHSRPTESLLLQRLLVEPFTALAFAHKPIAFPLKVWETEEWVA